MRCYIHGKETPKRQYLLLSLIQASHCYTTCGQNRASREALEVRFLKTCCLCSRRFRMTHNSYVYVYVFDSILHMLVFRKCSIWAIKMLFLLTIYFALQFTHTDKAIHCERALGRIFSPKGGVMRTLNTSGIHVVYVDTAVIEDVCIRSNVYESPATYTFCCSLLIDL